LRGENSGIANAAPTQPRSEKLFPDLNHIGNAKSIAASGGATASYCAPGWHNDASTLPQLDRISPAFPGLG
jgi:hypothetical protein